MDRIIEDIITLKRKLRKDKKPWAKKFNNKKIAVVIALGFHLYVGYFAVLQMIVLETQ
jgi:preprotein translocase subunit Sss1